MKKILLITLISILINTSLTAEILKTVDKVKDTIGKWSIEKWDLKKGWNPRIYRGERSYSKNTLKTVKDNFTGLIWQKKNKNSLTRTEAEQYCKELSLDSYSWRIPTIKELLYLVDITKSTPFQSSGFYKNSYPTIDREYFDIKTIELFWSNTKEVSGNKSGFRAISLFSGNLITVPVKDMDKNPTKYHVLCVSGE